MPHARARLAEQVIALHGHEILRVARRYSATSVDAEDAYQRALEVLLTKAPGGDAATLLPWMVTVTRNEALMIRRRADKIAPGDFDRLMASAVGEALDTGERIVEGEHLGHGREVLRRLKPDQVRCLLLRADGLGYPEICELTGFSYAKVNRLLSHGRKAFQAGVARLERGEECARLRGTLSLMADDEATPAARADAELHLEHCRGCRLTLAAYRLAPSKMAALLPVDCATGDDERIRRALGQLVDWVQSAWAWTQERLGSAAATLHQGAELSVAGKLAVAAAVTAVGAPAVGVAVDHREDVVPKGAAAQGPIAQAGFAVPAAGGVRTLAAAARGEKQAATRRRAEAERAAKRSAARRAANAPAATAAEIAGTPTSRPIVQPDADPVNQATAPAGAATVSADPGDTPVGTKSGATGAQDAGFAP